jgi:hypothetical protein
MQVEQRGGREGSSSVVLFQASNGNAIMRFSNATHVCLLHSISAVDEDNDDSAESAFAVVRLIETEGNCDVDADDMFTDISIDTPASLQPRIDVSALLVMHDLAVPALLAGALPAAILPAPVLPAPKVLPPSSYSYVFSHNSRMKQGCEVSHVLHVHLCFFPLHVHSPLPVFICFRSCLVFTQIILNFIALWCRL